MRSLKIGHIEHPLISDRISVSLTFGRMLWEEGGQGSARKERPEREREGEKAEEENKGWREDECEETGRTACGQ